MERENRGGELCATVSPNAQSKQKRKEPVSCSCMVVEGEGNHHGSQESVAVIDANWAAHQS